MNTGYISLSGTKIDIFTSGVTKVSSYKVIRYIYIYIQYLKKKNLFFLLYSVVEFFISIFNMPSAWLCCRLERLFITFYIFTMQIKYRVYWSDVFLYYLVRSEIQGNIGTHVAKSMKFLLLASPLRRPLGYYQASKVNQSPTFAL